VSDESIIRLAFFLGVLGLVAAWEAAAPRRRRSHGRWTRWPSNLAITALNSALVRLAFPVTAAGFALLCEQRGWGLLATLDLPTWLAVVVGMLVLDLAIYLQHVLFHAVPALWRLHRMHHADLDIDVTTGARFHPIEILASMAIKFAVIAAFGIPAAAALAFEVVLNATSMFNHGNIRMPAGLDRVLRWLVVTPDMHRVHHSIVPQETNSNFGFNTPWWDRLFGTYRAAPKAGHEAMVVGIPQFRAPREQWLDRMLTQPFREGAIDHLFGDGRPGDGSGREAPSSP
jgi:sterol desaturase/sphingolipid hydroxylase (fatty acid hydroxylase superfamily)